MTEGMMESRTGLIEKKQTEKSKEAHQRGEVEEQERANERERERGKVGVCARVCNIRHYQQPA